MNNVFNDEFPPELHGKVAPEEFQETILKVNNQLRRSMSLNLKWLLCGFICCCCTLGCSMWPAICVNRKVRRNIEKTLEIENARLYCQLGLNWSLTKQRSTEPVVLMEYVSFFYFFKIFWLHYRGSCFFLFVHLSFIFIALCITKWFPFRCCLFLLVKGVNGSTKFYLLALSS